MSVQCAVTCVDCGADAPPVGDGGYFGSPSLARTTSSTGPGYARIPTFGYVYEPFQGIHLRPFELEAFAEFLSRHEGHEIYLTSDHDSELPPALEELCRSEEYLGSRLDEARAYEAERDRRRSSGEFVSAFYCLDCPCGAYLAPGEPDVLRAFEPQTIEVGAVELLLARERAPDDGWNHRICAFWDPYGRFMEVLPRFLHKHVSHGLRASLRIATGAGHATGADIELRDDESGYDEPVPESFAEGWEPVGGVPPHLPDEAFDALHVARVGELYRACIALVGISAAIGIASRIAIRASVPIGRLVLSFLLLYLAVRIVVVGYRLAKSLDVRWPWLWAAGFCLPVLGVAPVLALSAKASAYFRRRGISVGLLGPSRASIAAYTREQGNAPRL